MKPLYIFVDESGNFDFSPGGTNYFLLTVLSTTEPTSIATPLLKLRYDLLPNYAGGSSLESEGQFHATQDPQSVRNAVFNALLTIGTNVRVDSVIVQKNKANPIFYKDHVCFYNRVGASALQYALKRATWQGYYSHVTLVFSSIFDKKKRGVLKQSFKSLIKRYATVPYALYFHDSKADLCNQAADYFGLAIYRKWESGDTRSYNTIRHSIQTEFDMFRRGTTTYY
jgi:hypothetical protein